MNMFAIQDAHEFLCQMLDQIKEESTKILKEHSEEVESGGSMDTDSPELKNPIATNFEFEVLHSIKCEK